MNLNVAIDWTVKEIKWEKLLNVHERFFELGMNYKNRVGFKLGFTEINMSSNS